MLKKMILFITLILLTSLIAFSNFSNVVKPFVEIAPSKSYFEIDGKPLICIGFNDGITWPSLSGLWNNSDLREVKDYFSTIHSYGINTLRIFFEYAQDPSGSTLFEDPLGHINESLVNVWDNIFKYAKEYDIYLIIEPFDPYWMSRNWQDNPFNIKNGGCISSLDEFLTNEQCIKNTESRFKFIIDHWGNSSHILAWEINNEIDLWYGENPVAISNWMQTISNFIINYEDSKFGHHHLITVSTAAPILFPPFADIFYDNKNLDFLTTHLYMPAVKNPTNAVEPAIEVSQAIAYNLSKLNYSKPYLDSEDGPIDNWPLPLNFDSEYYHNMSWAELCSGAAGIGLRWPYRIPHDMLYPQLLTTDKAISKFVNSPGINWLNFKAYYDAFDIKVENNINNYIIPFSCGDNNARIIWLLKDSRKDLNNIDFSSISLKVSNLNNGIYTIEFWDTNSGNILNSSQLEISNGTLNLKFNFSSLKDIAIKIYKTN
ncbi:MAG: cellulase family glycosylhydrolase [Nitrososphaeria archaeon]|nr:glycoside hydrolase family 5 protein [Candidatus Jingweiarchaeum tengchongense]MCW1306210.1 glycoside hydrolase family 5 protein [Candidatus Jingweiarchaeum tengchongense]